MTYIQKSIFSVCIIHVVGIDPVVTRRVGIFACLSAYLSVCLPLRPVWWIELRLDPGSSLLACLLGRRYYRTERLVLRVTVASLFEPSAFCLECKRGLGI